MVKKVEKQPAKLIADMQIILNGLKQHPELNENPTLNSVTLENNLNALRESFERKNFAAAEALSATQNFYQKRKASMEHFRRIRSGLYAHFGKTNPALVEFGLSPHKNKWQTKKSDKEIG
ncbi:MAG: hypothetical protein COT43_00385 [Candidatus Marinimicrobia bacterium CG08_land_8_20_14_0_20_45_22]|nr:MAG: hypothetical protein COT43_00385 [Candidatus Marinimicrobia bacterium CG08_land_8_20_14_0_20_45_22]